MEKITKREMYEALVSLMAGGDMAFERDGEYFSIDNDTMADFATHEIDLLDKKAIKAKEHAAKKKAESDALMDAVRAVMSDTDFESIPDITARLDDEDVTVGKVQYRLRKLVENGEAEKEEISIPATETSKARKIMGYKLCVTNLEG